MIDVFYINSNNKKINFRSYNYLITDNNNLADWEWNYEVTNNVIENIYRAIKNKTMQVVIRGDSADECNYLKNELFELTEVDICKKMPGKLYVGKYYIECYLIGKNVDNSVIGNKALETLSILPVSKAWIQKISKDFMYIEENIDDEEGHGYPYGYDYDYTIDRVMLSTLNNSHYTSCDFIMNICGYANSPSIIIGEHEYKVNADINENEVLTIDSKEKTIILSKNNSIKENLFSKREKSSYIFEKIPAGQLKVYRNGYFNFDITLIEERSEPEWT